MTLDEILERPTFTLDSIIIRFLANEIDNLKKRVEYLENRTSDFNEMYQDYIFEDRG